MKKIIFSLLLPLGVFAQNNPPINYVVKQIIVDDSDHIYLDLTNNTTTVKTQTGWDIALYNHDHEIGGKINETKGVRLYRVFKDTTLFNSLALTDTVNQVYNSDSILYYGAMDTFYSGNMITFFTIGIGKFYLDNYNAIPDRMYIIKREDNVWGKFYISYSSSSKTFTIRYADMDNTNAKTISVPKTIPIARHYKYIKLQDGTISNEFEPAYDAWDLVFRKYKVGSTTYPLGILTNNAHNLVRLSNITGFPADYLKQGVVKTECYEAVGDPSTVTYNGSLGSSDPISRLYNQIGQKWFNTSTNQPISGKSYFLKDKRSKLWHLVFCNYNASSKTLDIAFQNKGTASIDNINMRDDVLLWQNNNELMIEAMNHIASPTQVSIFDMNGKEIYKGAFNHRLSIDLTNMRNKLLFIHTSNNSSNQQFKYFVQ